MYLQMKFDCVVYNGYCLWYIARFSELSLKKYMLTIRENFNFIFDAEGVKGIL